jgi:hypothetical protein
MELSSCQLRHEYYYPMAIGFLLEFLRCDSQESGGWD